MSVYSVPCIRRTASLRNAVKPVSNSELNFTFKPDRGKILTRPRGALSHVYPQLYCERSSPVNDPNGC